MIPKNWLDLHTFHKKHRSNLACELETLFRCHSKSPMKLFVKKGFTR